MFATTVSHITRQPYFFARLFEHPSNLAPGEPAWEDEDPDADWEACDPADDELDDGPPDQDWWLDDESEDDDDPPQDDWQPADEEDDD